MNDCITNYERALKKALHCGKTAKARLSERFRTMLNAFLEENPSPDTQALHEAFGPPEEMAKLLMADTTEAERTQYRRKKLFLRIIAGVLLAAILLFAIYVCFVKSNPIQYYNEFTDYGTSQAGDPVE